MAMTATTMVPASAQIVAPPPEAPYKWKMPLNIERFEEMRDRLRIRMFSSEKHPEVTEKFYCLPVGETDLTMVVAVDMSGCLDGIDGAHALATPRVRDLWYRSGYSDDDVLAAAFACESKRGYFVRPIGDVLSAMGAPCGPSPSESLPLCIVSTGDSSFAAAGVLLPSVQKQILDLVGDPVYALPSSVHEMLVLPVDGAPDAQDLVEMVRTINSEVVEPRDVLSDHVYQLQDGILTTVI